VIDVSSRPKSKWRPVALDTVVSADASTAVAIHLTSKAMAIVWSLRGNIIRTVLYCDITYSMGTVEKNSLYSLVGP